MNFFFIWNQKFLIIMKNERKIMFFKKIQNLTIPWNSMEFYGILSNFHGIPWNFSISSMEQGITSMEFNGILWNCRHEKEYKQKSEFSFMVQLCHGIQWNSKHQSTVNSVTLRTFECRCAIEFHGTLDMK